jgi:hypothetical protein
MTRNPGIIVNFADGKIGLYFTWAQWSSHGVTKI